MIKVIDRGSPLLFDHGSLLYADDVAMVRLPTAARVSIGAAVVGAS
jgi:hypothetical protein